MQIVASTPHVSILMLTHNAPEYVDIAIRSVHNRTRGVSYEMVVVDNASDKPTRDLVARLYLEGLIDKLYFSDTNTMFSEGNNIASELASASATHYLLLNSDVRVLRKDWLGNLLKVHQRGATSYGIAKGEPTRVDGYCLLIDADLYQAHPLDSTNHQWWWAVTKQQAELLRAGHTVSGYTSHWQFVHHFGGRSGSGFTGARGMSVSTDDVKAWFDGHQVQILDGSSTARGALRCLMPGRASRWGKLATNQLMLRLPV